jgi:hypothetical protein
MEFGPRIHGYRARLLMIIRNGSETALLTEENSAYQRRVTAHDHPDPTRSFVTVSFDEVWPADENGGIWQHFLVHGPLREISQPPGIRSRTSTMD